MKVFIPIKTVSTLNAREHWAQRAERAKHHRAAAHWAMKGQAKPDLPCLIQLTRLSASALDTDNLAASQKSVRDGIADWLGIDDGSDAVRWVYAQEKCARGEFGVIVEVNP